MLLGFAYDANSGTLGKMLMFGGGDADFTARDDFWGYQSSTNTWTCLGGTFNPCP